MAYSFEKFQSRHSRKEDRITITKSFSIGFPSEFYHKNGIKDFKYAVLFWDAENKAVGVNFTNDEGEKKNAFLIARSKEGYGGSVSARSFFRHYQIDPQHYYGRYQWEKHSQDGTADLYVIKLRERT